MKSVAEPGYWSNMWGRNKLQYEPDSLTFQDIFQRHLPQGGDCFEVGCYPGGYLIYLSKKFNCRVHGIDMYPGVNDLPAHLRANGAEVGSIVQGDFFSFDPPIKYDTVCSFGFVEHFTDLPRVFKCHADLVKPGGVLILTCPNFRRLQFLLHWIFDRDNLNKHVIETMDLKLWKKELTKLGLEVIEQGYYRTFDFWVEPAARSPFSEWLVKKIRSLGLRINGRFNWPNRLTSAFMYTVCRKF